MDPKFVEAYEAAIADGRDPVMEVEVVDEHALDGLLEFDGVVTDDVIITARDEQNLCDVLIGGIVVGQLLKLFDGEGAVRNDGDTLFMVLDDHEQFDDLVKFILEGGVWPIAKE